MWDLQTSPNTHNFHLSHPSMYWSALAHLGGPVAVQQRHVTLRGQGSATLPPPTILMHTSSADLFDHSSSTLSLLPGLPFAEAQGRSLCEPGRQVLRF